MAVNLRLPAATRGLLLAFRAKWLTWRLREQVGRIELLLQRMDDDEVLHAVLSRQAYATANQADEAIQRLADHVDRMSRLRDQPAPPC